MTSDISRKADILKSYELSIEKVSSIIKLVQEEKVGGFNLAVRHITLEDITVPLSPTTRKSLLFILNTNLSRLKKERANLIKEITKAAS